MSGAGVNREVINAVLLGSLRWIYQVEILTPKTNRQEEPAAQSEIRAEGRFTSKKTFVYGEKLRLICLPAAVRPVEAASADPSGPRASRRHAGGFRKKPFPNTS